MEGGKPIVNLNGFDNYSLHILGPLNTERGEPDLKQFVDKFQDNNEFILHYYISDARWNKNTDMIKELEPPVIWKLDHFT